MTPDHSTLKEEPSGRDFQVSLLDYEAPEIDLSELTVVELLNVSESSFVFQVRWKEMDCVLKIYHHQEQDPDVPVNREVNPYLCESRAYSRLKAHGLCKEGHIPDFYGLIKDIDPKTEGWESYLEAFLEDPVLPNAVLMEYIPNLQPLELETFSTDRANQLRTTMAKMHRAEVFFGDLYPRNVKVQKETNRTLFIDFDHSETLSLDSKDERQLKRMHGWMKEEAAILHESLVELAEDHKRGKVWWSWWWHYESFDPPGWTEEDDAARLAAVQSTTPVDPAEQERNLEEDDVGEGESASKKQKLTDATGADEVLRLVEQDNEPKGVTPPLSSPKQEELCAH